MSQQRYRRRNINPMRHRIQINPNRSILLEDFRENRYGNFQLGDIVSHVVEFASDAEGSKFIQIKLDEATDNRKEMVFREMRQHLRHLMIHRFGNFVVQKFFDVGTMQQQFEIIVEIRDQFLLLSLHKYGCRIVQKAIQSSTIQYQNYLMQAINQEAALRMAVDANGNHVIQKIFRVASLNIQEMVFGFFIGHIPHLCEDLYGCRVIQCVLEAGATQQRDHIFEAINVNPCRLIEHRYGNYVIQFALRHGSLLERHVLIELIIENIVRFSQHKYASNVVEVCLNHSSPQANNRAFDLICDHNPEEVKRLCLDNFANYVIQKLIGTASLAQLQHLYSIIEPFCAQMQRYVSGRKVISTLYKRLGLQE